MLCHTAGAAPPVAMAGPAVAGARGLEGLGSPPAMHLMHLRIHPVYFGVDGDRKWSRLY